MRALHAASVLVSALLLFLIEPMIAKALLPLYGGSPAVWNTCLLFFQGLLLAGYAYAHYGARWLGPRGHLVWHTLIVAAPLVLLPPRIPTVAPPASAWPVPSLLATLALSVGLPFLVLASNTSMVQKWHARRSGQSPYFLYAASNIGSFVALLAYPFVIEPMLGLRAQLRSWALGYLVFVALTVATVIGAWRGAAQTPAAVPVARAPLRRRLRWLLRAAVPSSLLSAVTLSISTDVASIPLLWIVPLAIYLATFVIAFWPGFYYPRKVLVVLGAALIPISLSWPDLGVGNLTLGLGVPLAILFVGCWICHADLARDRPEPEQVTEYYLWIAAGGFAGGVFGNVVAPLVFTSVAEYPLSLALVTVLFSVGADQGATLVDAFKRRGAWLRLCATALVFVVWVLIAHSAWKPGNWGMMLLGVIAISAVLWQQPGQFAAACACTALIGAFGLFPGSRVVEARRSFFGVMRVRESGGLRRLVHGTTLHGVQRIDPFDAEPTAYYAALSPLSRAVNLQPASAHIAVVGLGAGAIAYYGKAGQQIQFYEIDPIIEPMARRWFTFLDQSKAKVQVKLGDARLTLRDAPDRSFDMMLLDAFSSDAIPVHLLTVEAVQLYMSKLKPDGLIVMHISNRHLDLLPVVHAISRRLGLTVAYIDYAPPEPNTTGSKVEAVALATNRSPLQKLLDRGWKDLEEQDEVLWTDDRSNLLSVIIH